MKKSKFTVKTIISDSFEQYKQQLLILQNWKQKINNSDSAFVNFHLPKPSKNTNLPLANVFFSCKDNFLTYQFPTTLGTTLYKDFHAYENATIVSRLLNAGAILVGKTNLDNFGMGGAGKYSGFGCPTNPYDRERICGGSSSGSASVVAQNISVFSIGSDTGDSIRRPASYCNLVGFKPTWGILSRSGMSAYSHTMDTPGLFTRNVTDCESIFRIIAHKDPNDLTTISCKKVTHAIETKKYYIGVFDVIFNCHSSQINQQFKEFITNKLPNNVEIVYINFDKKIFNILHIIYAIITYGDSVSNLWRYQGIWHGCSSCERKATSKQGYRQIVRTNRSVHFNIMVRRRLLIGQYFINSKNYQNYFLKAKKIRYLISQYMQDIFSKVDAFMSPTSGKISPKIKNVHMFLDTHKTKGEIEDLLILANLCGLPSISIPWFIDAQKNNLGYGLTITSNVKDDYKCLEIAKRFEKILGLENIIAP